MAAVHPFYGLLVISSIAFRCSSRIAFVRGKSDAVLHRQIIQSHTNTNKMKKMILVATIGLVNLAVSAAPLSTVPVSSTINYKFKEQFVKAENVSWHWVAARMLKAKFELNGERMAAFFDESGDLVATSVELSKSDLPDKLKAGVEKAFAGKAIAEMNYIDQQTDGGYYFSVMEDGKTKIYRAYRNGKIKEVTEELD
jgi:hypothetical protein